MKNIKSLAIILILVTIFTIFSKGSAQPANLISYDIKFYDSIPPQPLKPPELVLDVNSGESVDVEFLAPPPSELIIKPSTPLGEFNKNVLAIKERQNVVLSNSLEAYSVLDDRTLPVHPAYINTMPDTVITPGSVVSSFLFIFDDRGLDGNTFSNSSRSVWQGTLTFDRPVEALINANSKHDLGSTSILGIPSVNYAINSILDSEEDFVTFNGNQVEFFIATRLGKDPFRVILKGDSQSSP